MAACSGESRRCWCGRRADGQVETEGGVVGWGEGTLEGHTESVQGSLDDIGRRIIGWDAMNIEDVRYRAIL